MIPRPTAFVLALLLLSTQAFADRTTAEFHASRGDKALLEKDWAQAEEHFRKAMTEDATFHPARYGLSQALLETGRALPGVEELRKFVTDVKSDAAAPPAWKALVAKAEKLGYKA